MPIGAFKLNAISKYLAPSIAFTRTSVIVDTIFGGIISTAQSQFGGASWFQDGEYDGLQINDETPFDVIGTGNYTVECWVRRQDNPSSTAATIFNAATTILNIFYNESTNNLIVQTSGTTRITGGSISLNTWTHIAVTRSSGSIRLFIDGTQSGSTFNDDDRNFVNATSHLIGVSRDGIDSWVGYIDEFRVSKTARYTTTFTPSTTAFVNDADTVMLLHMDGTNGSTAVVDDNPVSYDSLAVGFAASPYLHIYNRSSNTFTKLSNPANLPVFRARSVAWNHDGSSLAAADQSSPRMIVYNRSGNTFTKLSNPATLPTGSGYGIAWNPAGTSLAVAHATTPFITIYNRSGDTFTKLSNPATLPLGQAESVAWNHDGSSLAVGAASSTGFQYVRIYNRSGDTFSLAASLNTGGIAHGVAWNPAGTSLAVASQGGTYLNIYNRSGDTFTKLSNPATLPSSGKCVAWNHDGSTLVIGGDGAEFHIYNRSGDTFTRITTPFADGDVLGVAFNKTGSSLAIAQGGSPYIKIYNRSGDTFTKLSDPADLPTDQAYSVAFFTT